MKDLESYPPLSVIIGGRPRVTSPGGADGNGGSEGRIARLEASVSHLEKDMQEVRADIREMRTDIRDIRDRVTKVEVRIDHLPSKGFVVTSVLITLAVLTSVITFQDRIQRLVHETPPAAAVSPPPVSP